MGKWKTETGSRIEFRADGTFESGTSPSVDRGEWTVSKNEMRLYYGSTKSKLRRNVARYLFGNSTSTFEIVEIQADKIVLSDKSHPEPSTLTKAND